MTTKVELKYNGLTFRVLCNKITVSGKKNIDVNPYTNSDGPVEGQTLSYENLSYTLQGVHYINEVGTLTWQALMVMYKQNYDSNSTGANGPIIMNVTYGDGIMLYGTEGSTDIKVLVSSFNLPIDVTDSKEGYLPIGSITLKETA